MPNNRVNGISKLYSDTADIQYECRHNAFVNFRANEYAFYSVVCAAFRYKLRFEKKFRFYLNEFRILCPEKLNIQSDVATFNHKNRLRLCLVTFRHLPSINAKRTW